MTTTNRTASRHTFHNIFNFSESTDMKEALNEFEFTCYIKPCEFGALLCVCSSKLKYSILLQNKITKKYIIVGKVCALKFNNFKNRVKSKNDKKNALIVPAEYSNFSLEYYIKLCETQGLLFEAERIKANKIKADMEEERIKAERIKANMEAKRMEAYRIEAERMEEERIKANKIKADMEEIIRLQNNITKEANAEVEYELAYILKKDYYEFFNDTILQRK